MTGLAQNASDSYGHIFVNDEGSHLASANGFLRNELRGIEKSSLYPIFSDTELFFDFGMGDTSRQLPEDKRDWHARPLNHRLSMTHFGIDSDARGNLHGLAHDLIVPYFAPSQRRS